MGAEFLSAIVIVGGILLAAASHHLSVWKDGQVDRDARRHFGPDVAFGLRIEAISANLRRLERRSNPTRPADTEAALAAAGQHPSVANYMVAYALIQRDGEALPCPQQRRNSRHT